MADKDETSKIYEAMEAKREELHTEMNSIMTDMDDKDFIVLLGTIASIEQGPAKLLLVESANRLARKIGN